MMRRFCIVLIAPVEVLACTVQAAFFGAIEGCRNVADAWRHSRWRA